MAVVISTPGGYTLTTASIPTLAEFTAPGQPLLLTDLDTYMGAIKVFAFDQRISPLHKAQQFFEAIQGYIDNRNIYELLIGCLLDYLESANLYAYMEADTGLTYAQFLLDKRWSRDIAPARKRWEVYKEVARWDPTGTLGLRETVASFDAESINHAASRVTRDFTRIHAMVVRDHPDLAPEAVNDLSARGVRDRLLTIKETMPYDLSRQKSIIVRTEEEVEEAERAAPTPVYWSEVRSVGTQLLGTFEMPNDAAFLRTLSTLYSEHGIRLRLKMQGSDETRYLSELADELAVVRGEPTSSGDDDNSDFDDDNDEID